MIVPVTLATQSLDSASTYVSFGDEPIEAVRLLKPFEEGGFGLEELMIDFNRKLTPYGQVTEIVDRLLDEEVIPSSKVKLIPMVPARGAGGLRKTAILHSIIEANYAAYGQLNDSVVSEVIHPVCGSVRDLVRVEANFNIIKNYVLESTLTPVDMGDISLIPALEDLKSLIDAAKIVSEYVHSRRTMLATESEVLRVYLGRDVPSVKAGMAASTIAVRLALSDLAETSEKLSVAVHPILESGSLPLKGNLNYESVNSFMEMYGGASTVTIQSSMVYDSSQRKTADLVRCLKDSLQGRRPPCLSGERGEVLEVISVFSAAYVEAISKIYGLLESLAGLIPDRRESLHNEKVKVNAEELSLPTRDKGRKGKGGRPPVHSFTLPPPVKYVALMYSLGVPPEIVGVGRALNMLSQTGLLDRVFELYYPSIEVDVSSAWRYLCLEAAGKVFPESFISDVKEDVKYIREFLDPKDDFSVSHRALAMMISEYVALKVIPEKQLRSSEVKEFVRNSTLEEAVRQIILQAGCIRGALG
nr:phosphoenolpyruvate carboxylase [Candidatus Freyrarchaeum guaymaensis]